MKNPSPKNAAARPAAAVTATSKTTPCCSKVGLKRGPWTPEEDELLSTYINKEGEGRWRTLPKTAGLLRCGESCRLRWKNYLHPSVKRGQIAPDEEDLILCLHRLLGNRWSLIVGRIPSRTDNEIKNLKWFGWIREPTKLEIIDSVLLIFCINCLRKFCIWIIKILRFYLI